MVLSEATDRLEDVKDERTGEIVPAISDPFAKRIIVAQLNALADAVKNDAGRHAAFPLREFLGSRPSRP